VLRDELRLLIHKIFGRRSERFSVEELQQSSLFDEDEFAIEENARKLPEPSIEVSAHRRRIPGCELLVRIGEETSEQVAIVPHLQILHVGDSRWTAGESDDRVSISSGAKRQDPASISQTG